MSPDDVQLLHMLLACQKIQRYATGLDEAAFLADEFRRMGFSAISPSWALKAALEYLLPRPQQEPWPYGHIPAGNRLCLNGWAGSPPTRQGAMML